MPKPAPPYTPPLPLELHSSGQFDDIPVVWTARPTPTDFLLVYVIAGGMRVSLSDKVYEASTGDLVTMPPDVPQDYRSLGEPWAWQWVHFGGDAAAAHTEAIRVHGGPVVRLGLDPMIREHFANLIALDSRPPLHLTDARPPAVAARDDARTNALLVGLLGLIHHRLSAGTDTPTHAPSLDAAAVRRYLLDRLSDPPSLPAMAETFALSTAHFSRLFRQQFGISPVRYLTRLRIDHAAELLHRTDLKLATIAARVGYDDPYHFSRVFKQTTGISPNAYRRKR